MVIPNRCHVSDVGCDSPDNSIRFAGSARGVICVMSSGACMNWGGPKLRGVNTMTEVVLYRESSVQASSSTRIKDAGIAIRHSRGGILFYTAGSGNGLEGVDSVAR